jgi:hypothetical protein
MLTSSARYCSNMLLAVCNLSAAATAATKQGRLAAYAEQPLLSCKVLEMALRANDSAASIASAFAAQVAGPIAQLCAGSWVEAAADQEQVRQVFALCISASKLAATQCNEGQLPAPQQEVIGVTGCAALLTAEGLEMIAQKEQHTQGATEEDSSGSSRSLIGCNLPAGISSMLVVLVARGLLLGARPELRASAIPAAAAAAASEATAAGSSSAPAPQITAAAASMLRVVIKDGMYRLACVLPAVELPGGAASEPAKQQLLQLQRQLLQDVQDSRQLFWSSQSQYSGSTAAVEPTGERQIDAAAAALDMLADQATALGEALCRTAATTLAAWSCVGRVSCSWWEAGAACAAAAGECRWPSFNVGRGAAAAASCTACEPDCTAKSHRGMLW